jgi:hypothetical protein
LIKQKKLIVTSIILVLIVLGLSLYYVNNSPQKFDDKVVAVSLVNQEITSDGLTYTINVTNNGRYTLKSNTLYFTARQYIQPVEAKATEGDKELIKPGERVKFTVFVPKEQFKDLQSSRIISSEIMLRGNVSWWFWKVPFTKSGNVDVSHPSLS